MDHLPNLTPDLPEPTEEEIKQTKKLIKDKYDTILPNAELARLVTLIKELEWWQKASSQPAYERKFSQEQLTDLKELLEEASGHPVSQSEVYEQAHSILTLVPFREKQRITDEIRGILVEHKQVPYEPSVIQKAKQLLSSQYDVMLNDEQLDQLIPFLARTTWFNEGLNSSLEECLKDLLQKKNNKLHSELREALDTAVDKLVH